MQQQLTTAATDIYSLLSEHIGGSDSDQVISTLRNATCIWVNDRFVLPKATALSCPLDVRPYIEPIPEEMEPFRDLFITLGVSCHWYFDAMAMPDIAFRCLVIGSNSSLNA